MSDLYDEITVDRRTMMEVTKTAHGGTLRGSAAHGIDAAFHAIARVGKEQGYDTDLWLVPTAVARTLAERSDAIKVYGDDIPDDHPALVAERAIYELLGMEPRRRGLAATCGHCRKPWDLTHTCEGQPAPVLPAAARGTAHGPR